MGPNSPRPHRHQFYADAPSFLRRRTQKQKKTWLGLKGNQCEHTFYNGGWSHAQLSYSASSSVQQKSGCDVIFNFIDILTSKKFIQSTSWRWLRNFTKV